MSSNNSSGAHVIGQGTLPPTAADRRRASGVENEYMRMNDTHTHAGEKARGTKIHSPLSPTNRPGHAAKCNASIAPESLIEMHIP